MQISIENYLDRLICDLLSFEKELEDLSLKIYPSKTMKSFILNQLLPIVQQLIQIVLSEKDSCTSLANVPPTITAIEYLWRTNSLQEIVNSITSTDLKSHPLEIMDVFKEFVRNIDQSDFEILTVPQEKLNFGFSEIWLEVKKYLVNNLDVQNLADKSLIKLTYPRKHKENVFFAGIYAHEIGHYFEEKHKMGDKIYTIFTQRKIDELNPYFTNINTGKPIPTSAMIVYLKYFIGQWIKEIVADCIAVYLLGPAYIFSSMDIAISDPGHMTLYYPAIEDWSSISHPRSGLRNRFQMKMLKDIKIYENLEPEIKSVLDNYSASWEASTLVYPQNKILLSEEVVFQQNDIPYQIAEEILGNCLTMIQGKVANLIQDQMITIEEIQDAMTLSRERLRQVVPPNELAGRPVSARAIINAGWIARLLYKDDILSQVGHLDKGSEFDFLNLMNDLLKYALHVSKIHERWQIDGSTGQ